MILLGDVRAVVIFSDDPERLAGWYRSAFSLREIVSSPGFVGLQAGAVSLFIQRTGEGHRPGMGGVRPHFTVARCAEAFRALIAAGATEILGVTDVGEEVVAAVQDPEGNPIGLLQLKRS